MRTCTVDDCEKKHTAKGMCQMHYRRNRLYKNPRLRPGRVRKNKLIISTNGYETIYEPENPNASSNGFVLVHRKVMSAFLGRTLSSKEHVHHKNGDRRDNRIENLELWSRSQPTGQRVKDKVDWAIEILKQYAPDKLKKGNDNAN